MPHVQCLLARGKTRQVAWIPAKFAAVSHVRLGDQDGWRIVRAFPAIEMDSLLIARLVDDDNWCGTEAINARIREAREFGEIL